MADNTKCPCGVRFPSGAGCEQRCPRCGRVYQIWNDGETEWLENPAVKAIQKETAQLEMLARYHFKGIERTLRRLERRVMRIEGAKLTRGRKK